ncbi:MAG: universal stress protein [Verrucomicrobiae bacterium]|nr:universal stress protein [Verrucomicrobiae bacterium]
MFTLVFENDNNPEKSYSFHMIKTLLLCVDGSEYSEAAIGSALWFSKRLKAQIIALSVVDISLLEGPLLSDLSGSAGVQPFQDLLPQMRDLYEKKAQAAVNEVVEAAKKENIPCETRVPTGLLVDSILEHERAVELVIMGQRGEGFEATGEWLGTNVERVVRKSIKPCLITPKGFRPVRSILAAYDGSQHANHALYVAFELAKTLKAALTIMTVENTSDEEEKSWALKEAMDLALKQGSQAKPLALHGIPEEKILEITNEGQHDLLVLGAYGHTRLREFVLGSVTNHVIRKSTIPVLLVR